MGKLLIGFAVLMPALAWAQDDWANLARFSDENSSLGEPARGEDRIVFIGDSITEGWSRAAPSFFEDRPYIERGIGGQTTPQMLLRFRVDVVNLQPRAVVILAGTNDIAGNTGPATNEMIQDNLASMAEIASANDIRVIIASILPAERYPWRPGVEPAFRILAINRWIKDYAEANDHIYLDYYSLMVNDVGGMQERYTTDGVHVSEAGYALMRELVEDAIGEAMDRPREDRGAGAVSSSEFFRPLNGCSRSSGNRRQRPCD